MQASPRDNLLVLGGIALAVTALHVATNGRFGLQRDELQVLDDAATWTGASSRIRP